MFDRVLIGVAEPESGRDAAELAKLLAAADGCLTLAFVHSDPMRLWGDDELPPSTFAAERAQAQAMLAQIRDAVGVEASTRCVEAPTPGRGLHELAHELDADLLVVGSSRRGLMGRVLLGDDTRAALAGVASAVAIAPAGFAQSARPPQRIGIGYDGSPESEQALALARALAERYHARIAAMEVVGLPSTAGGVVWLSGDELLEAARQRVGVLEGVEAQAVYGLAAEELAHFSGSVDLLIVGSRGYGPLGRLIHGSTSQRLARSSHCPLLVLPRSARPVAPRAEAATGAANAANAA